MMYATPDLQRAFDQGANAACASRARHANPYPADSFRAVVWDRGFDYASAVQATPEDMQGAGFWFAPGAVEHYAPPRRLSLVHRVLTAVALCAALGFALGYFNPGGLFR